MCIIATKPKGVFISKETAKNCFDNNPDGAGFMFASKGALTIRKGFFDFDKFWGSYCQAMVKNDNPTAILHFRITTHGLTDKSNCHPFQVNQNLGFAHNGVIHFVDNDKTRSDTSMFNDTVLKLLPKDFLNNQGVIALIEEAISSNSKLAFLDNDGNYTMCNEHKGLWDNGIWYSNETFESCTIHYNYGSYYWGGHGLQAPTKPKKKKKKKKYLGGVIRYSCKQCKASLSTLYEQNNGMCSTCDNEHYSI